MSIYDIARLAGVSITTVSRVINKRKVREEVKQKILAIIAQYNYRPDPLAQSLARRKNIQSEISPVKYT
jgi:LacI family transcriptional regulator